MIRIKIESVGFVEVLALSTQVTGRATVLVDLGDGFRDRYVVWTLGRTNVSTCKGCGRRITNVQGERGWLAAHPVAYCAAGDPHEPTSDRYRHEYVAFNGDYHAQRMVAEARFERRAGFRNAVSSV